HGLFALDGSNPMTMLETMRAQVSAYPTVHFINKAAVDAARNNNAFRVTLTQGEVVTATTLLLAFGITDILPDMPGLVERWGKSVVHCPDCHGYEFSGKRLGVLNLSAMSSHQASLVAEWGPTIFLLNGGGIAPEVATDLTSRGIALEPAPVK